LSASTLADNALHVGEVADGAAVDRHHQVAGLKAGGGSRAIGLHRVHAGGHGLLAVKHEDAGKNHDGQKEICQRSGQHDGRAFAYRLEHEALRLLGLVHGRQARTIRHAGGVLVAEEFHIAAQRNGGNLPPRTVTVVEAYEFRAKTDGKHQNLHPAPTADEEMPQFVEEHDKAEDKQKGDDQTGHIAPKRMQMRQ
jgi:hypothetical protein